VFVFKLVNGSLASNVMSSVPVSTVKGEIVQIWHRLGPRTPMPRKLFGWAAVAFATLKDLAPYAAIELLLPGGSLMALTLWFYRRRKRVPVLARSLRVAAISDTAIIGS
jgi:hypothetical protein